MSAVMIITNENGKRVRCDATCYDAKERDARCACICGGANHGVGAEKAAANTRAQWRTWLAEYRRTHPDIANVSVPPILTIQTATSLKIAGIVNRKLLAANREALVADVRSEEFTVLRQNGRKYIRHEWVVRLTDGSMFHQPKPAAVEDFLNTADLPAFQHTYLP